MSLYIKITIPIDKRVEKREAIAEVNEMVHKEMKCYEKYLAPLRLEGRRLIAYTFPLPRTPYPCVSPAFPTPPHTHAPRRPHHSRKRPQMTRKRSTNLMSRLSDPRTTPRGTTEEHRNYCNKREKRRVSAHTQCLLFALL